MAETWKMGVIGLGMGINMLPVNNRADIPIEVTQICGTESQTDVMDGIRKQYSLSRCTTDWKDITDDESIGIVGVFSPDPLHFEHCKRALENGKHVICTKPMMTGLGQAKEIAALVKEKNVKFMVGQTMRYEAQFAALRTMFDDGDLGDVFMGEAHYVHDMRELFHITPWRGEMPQDMIYGGLSHPVDAMRWFFGDVEEVHALGCDPGLLNAPSGREYGDMCNYMVNLRFKNGIIARCLGAYGIIEPPMPMMGITLYGSKGSATAEFSDFLGGKVKTVLDKFEIKSSFESLYPPEKEGAFGHGRTALRYLEHFGKCLVSDETPVPDVTEGAKTVATCAAAYESMKTGKIVRVCNEF